MKNNLNLYKGAYKSLIIVVLFAFFIQNNSVTLLFTDLTSETFVLEVEDSKEELVEHQDSADDNLETHFIASFFAMITNVVKKECIYIMSCLSFISNEIQLPPPDSI